MNTAASLHARLEAAQKKFFITGAAGLALCSLGGFANPIQFFHSYLLAFMFWTGIALGCAAILMLHHITGGAWGFGIRRMLEAGTRTFPLLAVLFVPLALGLTRLYAWAQPDLVVADPILQYKRLYLNVPFFLLRAAIYFAVWNLLAFFLNKWSAEQDAGANPAVATRFEALSGPGLVLYGLTATFAAIDWVMSLSPRWASTIYGFLFVAGQAISAMALMIAVIVLLAGSEPFKEIIKKRHLHDLAKLLFAFNMLWAYFAFSQLLIIWSGNQPEEITFYRSRLNGQWGVVAVVVLLFSFAIPFLLLLSRDVKRTASVVSKIAVWMIFMRLVDLYWMTRPEFTSRAVPTWLDIVVPVALVGLWLGFFAMNLKQRPLLPVGDPNLSEALAQNEH